jgi:hypothetical protein
LHQGLRCFGIGRLGACQRLARLFADQGLRAQLLVQVFDLLGPRQQACLLGVGRVETDAVAGDRMAAGTKMASPACSSSRWASASSRLGAV